MVLRLRSDYSARQRRAQAISATASSSSQWPSPDAAICNDGEEPETFLARREALKAKGINGNGMGMPLAMAAKTWPTPTANDWKGSGPTLERKDGLMRGDRLDYAVEQLWSTPRSSDGEKGTPNQSFGAGGIPLPAQASQWMTPRVARGSYTRDNGDPEKQRLSLEGQATLASFLPDHPISTVGEESSKIRRSLNPLFVEWLMGWPPGWTLLALTPPASNACACSATALSHYRQRMRSRLSALGLPPQAPPAQLGLFG